MWQLHHQYNLVRLVIPSPFVFIKSKYLACNLRYRNVLCPDRKFMAVFKNLMLCREDELTRIVRVLKATKEKGPSNYRIHLLKVRPCDNTYAFSGVRKCMEITQEICIQFWGLVCCKFSILNRKLYIHEIHLDHRMHV